MSTFYAKSRKVDAVQWFKDGDHPEVFMVGGDPMFSPNSDFPVDVDPGDWVVTLPSGQTLLYAPEGFAELYSQDGGPEQNFADHVREVSSEFSSVHGRRLIVVDEAKLKAFLQATE